MCSDFAAGCTVITSLLHNVLLRLKVLKNENKVLHLYLLNANTFLTESLNSTNV